MYCSLPSRPTSLLPLAFALALSASTGATADYQQTLAARGADAFAQPTVTVEIDNEELANTFSNNFVEANPALSDQEVMVDLQSRIRAQQRLEMAAADLDLTAVSDVAAQTAESRGNSAQSKSAEPVKVNAMEMEGEGKAVAQSREPGSTPAVASR